MIRYYPITRPWQPLSVRRPMDAYIIQRKLEILFDQWKGTPYMAGNQCKQSGVDCVRWVTAILDMMYGRPPTDIKTLPSDASFHNKRAAMRAMLKIKRLYPHCKVLRNNPLEPGDLIIVGPPGGGPGHAMLVGTEKNTLWHCAPRSGVCKTGWSLIVGHQHIFRVYRAKDRVKLWTSLYTAL
jgi:hypothetical protein